jgi:hypothetical protein
MVEALYFSRTKLARYAITVSGVAGSVQTKLVAAPAVKKSDS